MKLVIIGVPSNTPEEVIQSASTAFAVAANMDTAIRVLDTKEFNPNNVSVTVNEEDVVKEALEEIASVCTATSCYTADITANFWRLMHDGKISPQRIKLLNKYPNIIGRVCVKHHCPCLKDLLKSAEIYLS